MKLKELNSLREKSLNETKSLLNKKIFEIQQVNVKNKVSKEKNLKHIKMLRRDISQIKTIVREKELAEKVTKTSNDTEK